MSTKMVRARTRRARLALGSAALVALLSVAGPLATGCNNHKQGTSGSTGTGQPDHPGLLDPSKAAETAPETFKAKFETTKGAFTVEATRAWSPNGADRFYNLVKIGFFTDVAFFRAVEGFMVQFGISGRPDVSAAWERATIPDDKVVETNARGMLTFAKTGLPNSRSTQLFINYGNNARLDGMGFAPVGKVVEGMETLDALYKGYGEKTTSAQGKIKAQGNAFLKQTYPELDYIKSATLL